MKEKIRSLDMFWITVNDLNKAIKFYTENVGLKLCERHDEYGWAELSGTESGARLGLAQISQECPVKPGQNGVFTLTVDNLEDYKKSAKGVTFIGAVEEVSGHVKLQMCHDQDKNLFQVVEVLHEDY